MIDKTKMKGHQGVWLTHSLFLEICNYNTDLAVFTTKDADFEYKGKLYPSLKQLYLEMNDPTEYEFAVTYLGGWNHWKRMQDHKALGEMFNSWREELAVRFKAQAVRNMVMASMAEKPSFQAIKWLADAGWDGNKAGRPTKEKRATKLKAVAVVQDEYEADIQRLK